jgi:hypothetical protein
MVLFGKKPTLLAVAALLCVGATANAQKSGLSIKPSEIDAQPVPQVDLGEATSVMPEDAWGTYDYEVVRATKEAMFAELIRDYRAVENVGIDVVLNPTQYEELLDTDCKTCVSA